MADSARRPYNRPRRRGRLHRLSIRNKAHPAYRPHSIAPNPHPRHSLTLSLHRGPQFGLRALWSSILTLINHPTNLFTAYPRHRTPVCGGDESRNLAQTNNRNRLAPLAKKFKPARLPPIVRVAPTPMAAPGMYTTKGENGHVQGNNPSIIRSILRPWAAARNSIAATGSASNWKY